MRDLFFRNLSERAARMLQEEISSLGPVKLRDVDDAQAAIVVLAKEMASKGEIEIGESDGEEMVD